jgi:hypothetical protein
MRNPRVRVLAYSAVLTVNACAHAAPQARPSVVPPLATIEYADDQLGSSSNPVKAGGPFGQRDFLRRLVCPNGDTPSFERSGSYGPGPDRHMIDGYDVVCAGDGIRAFIFMDMYHPEHRERSALPPFEVLEELPARTAQGCPPSVHADPDSSARYVFNALEVETPARLLTPPDPAPGDRRTMRVSFIVGVDGIPEIESLVYPPSASDSARSQAARAVGDLRYSPALHHESCPVRSVAGVRLSIAS